MGGRQCKRTAALANPRQLTIAHRRMNGQIINQNDSIRQCGIHGFFFCMITYNNILFSM